MVNITEPVDAIDTRTRSYPETPLISRGWSYIDDFSRENLNPSGAITGYTTGGVGTPSHSIQLRKDYKLATSAAIGNTAASVFDILGMGLNIASAIDTRSKYELDFMLVPNTTVTTKGFVGIVDQSSILTALPTTTRHLGIYWDTSVDNNFRLSSANGTTQSTTDTGTAIAATVYRLNVLWNGIDSATIKLFSGSGTTWNTEKASQTVTSFYNGATSRTLFPHFYAEALAAASSIVLLTDWKVKSS